MKKFFAYLLALCMVLGVVTATALASEGEGTEQNVTAAKIKVEIGNDVPAEYDTITNAIAAVNATGGDAAIIVTIPAGTYTATDEDKDSRGLRWSILRSNVTVQGAGVDATTLDCSSVQAMDGQASIVLGANNVTLKDMTVVSSVATGDAIKVTALDPIGEQGITLLTGCKLENLKVSSTNGHGINLHGVDGCTVTNVTATSVGKSGISLANAKNVTISGCSLTGKSISWGDIGLQYKDDASLYANPCTVTLGYGNTFGLGLIKSESASYVVTLGADASAMIVGPKVVAGDYTLTIPNGYTAVKRTTTGGDYYTIDFEWGGTKYSALAQAITAAQDGDTITLYAGEYELPLFSGKELTFKGVDKENVIVNDAPAATQQGWNGSTFHFENLTAKGATEIYHGLANGVVKVTYKNCNVNNLRHLYATELVSFEDCIFTTAAGVEHCFYTYGASNVTVIGCTFNYADRAVNCYSESGADHETDISFSDCDFVYTGTADAPDGAVEINSSSIKSIDVVFTDECTGPAKGAMWFIPLQWDSKGGANTTVKVDGLYVWTTKYEAQIGDTGYETLAEAIAQGGEITLLKDVTTANPIAITKDTTINGNGHTLTYTGSNRAIEVANQTDADVDLTIQNMTVAFSGYSERGINYNENGTLTLTNVIVNGPKVTYALNLPGMSTGATVDISGGSYKGRIALNVWGQNCKITAENAVFTSVDDNAKENYAALKLNNNGSTSAEGATITVIGGSVTALDESGNKSSAATNATASGKFDLSGTTVNGEINEIIAIVAYEGYTQFYGCFTLQDAITTATDDAKATVKLLKDIEESITVSGAVKLDLNSKTLNGTITLADADATLTAPKDLNVVADVPNSTVPYYVTYVDGKYVLAPMHTISINLNGGSYVEGVSDYKMYTGDKLTEIQLTGATEKITRDGYTFKGWYDAPEGGNQITTATVFNANGTIYAQWTKVDYTITYNLDGGVAEGNPDGYNFDSADITLINPTKEGYTFAGWTGADLSEATVDVTIASGSTGNREYTATWTINQYTITFEGADIAPITQNYGTEVVAPENPTKTGYTFAGWDKTIPTTMPAENVTITANWTISQYTIIFVSNGSTYKTITQDYGTSVQAPSNPSRSGYTFKGWDKTVPTTMPAEDMTITAKWSKNYVPPTTTTEKTENEDGSTTTTVTNNKTGTTTSTTENTDGSTTVTETKKDGTSTSTTTGTTTETGEDGSTTKTDSTVTESVGKDGTTTKTEEKSETTEAADGSTTKTETKAETVTGTDGSVTATETKTETTEAADGSTTKTETKAETVTGTDGTETKTETKTETTQNADGTTSTATTETKTETKTEEDGSVISTETKTETTENADGTTSTATTETKTTSVTTTDETTGATVTETKVETKVESEEKTVTSTATETKTEATDGTTETVKVEETVEQTAEATTTTKTTATTTATEEKTETVAVKEETVTKEDGTTETKTTTTTETALADGTTATATTDESGKTEASVTVSEQAAAAAVETGAAVALPIPAVSTTTESEAAATVTVNTNSTENTKVEIPVAEVSTSTVAVIVNEDGTETVITETKMTENGLVVDVPDGATVKIVDNSTDFDDVEDEDWEKDAVNFASARGLVNGMGNNQFDLDSTATRAQVVTLLARLSGVDTTPGEGEKWYDKAQEWAVANGITYAGGMNNTITRHEMMTLLWRFVGSPKSEQDLSDFADADELNAVTTPAARWAVEIGLVQGNGNGTMTPTGSVTRGQLAQFLMNFVQKT